MRITYSVMNSEFLLQTNEVAKEDGNSLDTKKKLQEGNDGTVPSGKNKRDRDGKQLFHLRL